MNEKDKLYWQHRQEQKFLAGEKKVNQYYKDLEKSFEQSKREIRKIINDFYGKYADENGVSFAAAQRMLSREEVGELKDFISLVNANMGKYNQELNNMSIKARITRYQALEKQLDATLQQLYALEYQVKGEEVLKDIYSDTYYRNWYNTDVYSGFHQEFAQINEKSIEELIMYPFNGANFSTRLWKQKDHLLQQLNESITTMLVQGKNPTTLTSEIAKKFDTKKYEAYRLLHTEGSFITEQATLATYKEDGVTQYEILATLDQKTSEICQGQDGEIYDIDKAVTGDTYPPFHIFCRTTTIPYYDDMERDTRAARAEDGTTYKVPADMKYPDWKRKYVDGLDDEDSGIITPKDWTSFEYDKKIYNTKNEMINHFRDRYGIEFKDSKKYPINKDLMNNIVNWLDGFHEYFPDFKNVNPCKIPIIENKAASKMKGSVGMYTHYTSSPKVVDLGLNGVYHSDIKLFESYVKKAVEVNWTVPNAKVHKTFVHEYGHHISHAMEHINKKSNWQHEFISECIEEFKKTTDYKYNSYIGMKEYVSEYGSTSESELFAETFAEYFGGENPREFATIFGNKLEALLKAVK